MHVEEAIAHRRSVRRFLPEEVSVAEIRNMLNLASQAPNLGNRQMWRYIVVTDADLRRMLGRLVERSLDEMSGWVEFEGQSRRLHAIKEQAVHFVEAPVAIFVVNQGYHNAIDPMLVAHGMKPWETGRFFGCPDIQAVSSMIAYLTLVAESRGYATCWITSVLVAKKDIQTALELIPGEELLALVTLGKPAEHPAPKERKPIDTIIEWR